jgi:hypothetical protein
MEPKSSLSCPQQPSNDRSSNPDESRSRDIILIANSLSSCRSSAKTLQAPLACNDFQPVNTAGCVSLFEGIITEKGVWKGAVGAKLRRCGRVQ